MTLIDKSQTRDTSVKNERIIFFISQIKYLRNLDLQMMQPKPFLNWASIKQNIYPISDYWDPTFSNLYFASTYFCAKIVNIFQHSPQNAANSWYLKREWNWHSDMIILRYHRNLWSNSSKYVWFWATTVLYYGYSRLLSPGSGASSQAKEQKEINRGVQ